MVAVWLKVNDPAPNGLLIIGANTAAIKIGTALRKCDINVQIIDNNYQRVQAARTAGLSTYHGHPTSAHAEQHLQLSGAGTMMALSHNQDLNALAAVHFREEFGSERVYLLSEQSGNEDSPAERSSELTAFGYPFSNGITYDDLNSAFSKGAEISIVKIDKDVVDFESMICEEIEKIKITNSSTLNALIPLFLVNDKGELSVFQESKWPTPIAGSKVLMLKT